MNNAEVIVVGAGIAGIVCARTLLGHNRRVLLLDKGRSVGGRMASRRIDGATVDHGAQFFTVRNDAFREVISELERDGVVVPWTTSYINDDGFLAPDGQQRYRGHPSMNAIAKALAGTVPVETEVKVSRLTRDTSNPDGWWSVHAEDGREFHAPAVVLTPPVPQTLSLLEQSGIDPGEAARNRLEKVEYSPCLCVIAVCNEPHPIPGPGAIQLSKGPVQWIADNNLKGISPSVHALTIHATAAWSTEHYDDPDDRILELITEALEPWLELGNTVMQVKRWRYARVSRRPGGSSAAPSLRLETEAPLYCAGDGLASARVESAALSGRDAAEQLLADPSFSRLTSQS